MARVAIVAGTGTQRPYATLPAGWTPLQVKSGVSMSWYNGDTGSISSWTDQGTQVRHLLQSNGSKQPTLQTSSFGKQVFQFASTQFMQTAAFTAMATDIELMIVCKFTNAPGAATYLFDGQANNQFAVIRNADGTIQATIIAGATPKLPLNLGTTGWHLYHLFAGRTSNGPNTFIAQDDLLSCTGNNNTPSISITKFTLAIAGDAASLPTDCQVRNIFVSSGALVTADRRDLIKYFKADAGLT